MSAIISPCGAYRYFLSRALYWMTTPESRSKIMTFIMLNPSTADATTDDRTIEKCIHFAKKNDCGELQVVNLFALRSTDPKNLRSHHDPVGPENMMWIERAIQNGLSDDPALDGIVVCAWGADKTAIEHKQNSRVMRLLGGMGIKPYCLRITKEGHPWHPLYLKKNSELQEYSMTHPLLQNEVRV